MEISLIRHGKSLCISNKPISYTFFRKWVIEYDNVGVCEEDAYPSDSIEKVLSSELVFTSHLKRALHSAYILNPTLDPISDVTFREVELPILVTINEKMKLKPNGWAVILRIMWFLGYSNGCESYKSAKKRATRAADKLIEAAKEHNNIVLVGHGFFNKMIAKELKRNGWTNRKISTNHWVCNTFLMFHQREHE
ncbi:histidine phosphatase family protein [Alkalihalobacillus sp. R86527]|uniref:histidine phosphatase family protein n=1 Tax=Alkalihalobacillus sp. R86527 TaxID=3093863 RepID=UPI00366E062D